MVCHAEGVDTSGCRVKTTERSGSAPNVRRLTGIEERRRRMPVLLQDKLGRIYQRKTNSERFWLKVDKMGKEDCWNWLGHVSSDGYGIFDLWVRLDSYTSIPAARFAYLDTFGAMPNHLQADHLCRNRLCCNPAHLEAVTQQENIERGEVHLVPIRRAIKRHACPHGHEYNLFNTYIRPSGSRECRLCRRLGLRELYRRKKEGSYGNHKES